MCFTFCKCYVLWKPSESYSSTELISIATETPDKISYWLAQQCEIEKEREKGWRQRGGNVPVLRFTAGGSQQPTIPPGANLHTHHRAHTHTVSATVNNGNWMPLCIAMATPPSPSLKHLESFRPIHDPNRFPMEPRSSQCQGILDRIPVFQN